MSHWLIPIWLMVAATLSLVTIDYPLGHLFDRTPLDGEFERILDASEHFGTPYGQGLILLAVGALSQWWEPRIIRMLLSAIAAGMAANLMKMLVARERPHAFTYGDGTIWGSFETLFPFGVGGSDWQSFPSAHTASAVGFAMALSWAYPNGRAAFWSLAVLVGLQRICRGDHFPSDVLCGFGLGYAVAVWFVVPCRLSRQLDRWERTWASWRPAPYAHRTPLSHGIGAARPANEHLAKRAAG